MKQPMSPAKNKALIGPQSIPIPQKETKHVVLRLLGLRWSCSPSKRVAISSPSCLCKHLEPATRQKDASVGITLCSDRRHIPSWSLGSNNNNIRAWITVTRAGEPAARTRKPDGEHELTVIQSTSAVILKQAGCSTTSTIPAAVDPVLLGQR